MRFRSIGVAASSLEEYLTKIKEKENCCLEEFTLTHLRFINLEEKRNNNEEYELLGYKSNYKMKNFEHKRRKRKRIRSNQFFRKKLLFVRHKRNRINSESINICNTKIKILEGKDRC